MYKKKQLETFARVRNTRKSFVHQSLLILFFSSAICTLQAAEWSYDKEAGPAKWGKLATEYSLCSKGKNQSPINIDTQKSIDIEPPGIKFNYGIISPRHIINTGNLIQITIGSGTSIKVDDMEFELTTINLHIPSEHTIDGKHFPMEMQFEHETEDGQLAMVSRMVIPGRPDRTLRKLLEVLPAQTGQSARLPANALRNIEMRKKYNNYFRYNGSSTTPPCQEGVRWYIIKNPMSFSKEQYEKLKSVIKQDNNRPTQALNARLVAK